MDGKEGEGRWRLRKSNLFGLLNVSPVLHAMQTPRGQHNLGKVAEIRAERLDHPISLLLLFFLLGRFVFEAFDFYRNSPELLSHSPDRWSNRIVILIFLGKVLRFFKILRLILWSLKILSNYLVFLEWLDFNPAIDFFFSPSPSFQVQDWKTIYFRACSVKYFLEKYWKGTRVKEARLDWK